MNLIINYVALPLVILLSGLVFQPQYSSQDEPILDRMSLKIQDGYIFEADMSHEFVDAFTRDTVYTRGKIWVGADRYKVMTFNQEISVEGEVSTVYNRDQNKVIISRYYPEEDDFAPSRFMGNMDSGFTVKDQMSPENGFISVRMEADNPFEMITQAQIIIFESELIPVEIHAVDQSENEYSTWFTDGRFIRSESDMFEIRWPNDAEVIDLREN